MMPYSLVNDMESGIAALQAQSHIDNDKSSRNDTGSDGSLNREDTTSPGPSSHFRRRFRLSSTNEDPARSTSSPLYFTMGGGDSDSEFEDPLEPSPPAKSNSKASLHSSYRTRIRLPSEECNDPESVVMEANGLRFSSTHSKPLLNNELPHGHLGSFRTSEVHRDDSDSHLAPQPPVKVDLHAILTNYKLQRTLGEGAFAKVKQAIHKLSGMTVAVKVVYKKCITADYVRENLQREGDLLRLVDHPNVVKLLEIIETDDIYCLVTEIATGGELLDYIVTHNTLNEKEARKYTRQMIKAIQHLHNLDIVHRDLKTENLLLDNDFNLKVVDFGLSNSMAGKTTLHTMCGSPAYTAPELLGGKQYGKPVDIWSIGINLYAMLTGKLPFSSDNVTTLHAMILDQDFDIPASFSNELREVLLKILVAKPKNRITLSELAKHPWVCKDGLDPVEEFCKSERGEREKREKYNNTVLDFMESKLNLIRSEVIESVDNREHNHLHSTYLLLCMKLKKKGHLHSHKKQSTKYSRTQSMAQKASGLHTSGSEQHLHKLVSKSRGDVKPSGPPPSALQPPRRRVSVSHLPSRNTSRKSSATLQRTSGALSESVNLLDSSSRTSLSPTSSRVLITASSRHPSLGIIKTPTEVMEDEFNMEEAERYRVQTALSQSRASRALSSKVSPSSSTNAYHQSRRRQSFHVGDVSKGKRLTPFTSFDESGTDFDPPRTSNGPSRRSSTTTTTNVPRHSLSRASINLASNGINASDLTGTCSTRRRKSISSSSSRRGSETLPSITSLNTSANLTSAISRLSGTTRHLKRAGSSKDKRFDNIRTLRVPLNKALLSQMEPRMILGEVERAVGVVGLPYSVSFDNGVCIVARTPEISMEIELVKVAGLDVHSLHFSRLRGEHDDYTKLYKELLQELEM
eukprot:m.74297 g.74297  ORF g.74297 m.74297 type:complete len:914 (-) comp8449_c0_seq1:306-3047(-)